MKLIWFEIDGYKRFSQKTRLHLDGKLVAIVGPNESGKTSILQAIEHLNSRHAVINKGPSQETTRGIEFDEEHEIITAIYLVDEDDREAISDIPEANEIRWYSVTKKIKGEAFYIAQSPVPKRNLKPRADALNEITKLKHEIEKPTLRDNDERLESKSDLKLDSLCDTLSSEEQTLSDTSVEFITETADLIEQYAVKNDLIGFEEIPKTLRELAEVETLTHPEEKVLDKLFERLPRYLKFSSEDRDLRSEYNLKSFFFNEKGAKLRFPNIPKAIKNLASACNLNLQSLYDARDSDDEGMIATILDQANEKLSSLMEYTWSQSNVTVRLQLNQLRLHLLVGAKKEQFVKIAERSDGLRQFVALLMFLSTEEELKVPPILLIDEAERHLHYDAQADLVQMLARQNIAEKVIYTTHSIGCLPEDLGNGVRLVEQVDNNHSIIRNSFWSTNVPGFSNLLFGMGANTLAFLPVRFAVIVEGPSDILLLPTLLRTANDVSYLGFQVAPGLSIASRDQIAIINKESPRTIYLTDSDKGGNELKKQILNAGIPEEYILQLPKIDNEGSVIEDFVSKEVYASAVNQELKRSHGNSQLISVDEISAHNRPESLKSWCITNKIPEPKRCAVSYRILESIGDTQLLEEGIKPILQNLLKEIRTCLEIET